MQRETWCGNERTDMFRLWGLLCSASTLSALCRSARHSESPCPNVVSNGSTDVNIKGRSTCADRKLPRNPKGIHQMTNSDRSFQAMMSGPRRKWGEIGQSANGGVQASGFNFRSASTPCSGFGGSKNSNGKVNCSTICKGE